MEQGRIKLLEEESLFLTGELQLFKLHIFTISTTTTISTSIASP
jgi:hypothetical protein